MKTFQEQYEKIIAEIFQKGSKNFEHVKSKNFGKLTKHIYLLDTDTDMIKGIIVQYPDHGIIKVNFESMDGSIEATNKGKEQFVIFGAFSRLVEKFLIDNPDTEHVIFSVVDDSESRISLYDRICRAFTKKYGTSYKKYVNDGEIEFELSVV